MVSSHRKTLVAVSAAMVVVGTVLCGCVRQADNGVQAGASGQLESSDEVATVRVANNGWPVLEQFSQDGFVDCTFRIVDHRSSASEHRFHLAADFHGEAVGMDVVVVKGMRGAFDQDINLIDRHVYRGGVRFIRSGQESDRLFSVLANLYGLPSTEVRMVDSISFTAILLHMDGVDMESDPVKVKLFGRDSEQDPADEYFESFFNLDLKNGLVFWNEKDHDYREPLIRGCTTR